MDDILLFTLLGLGSGALISGIAVGLVLTYRGNGVINVATGGVAMLAAYTFWAVKTGEFGPTFATPIAGALALVVSALVGVAMEFLAFRPLSNTSPLSKLVASLGVLLVAQSAMLLMFGPSTKAIPAVLPTDTVTIFDTRVPVANLILPGIVVIVTILLVAFYHRSRFGLETRAAFENASAAQWTGLSPNKLSLANTVISCVVVGLVAILSGSLVAADSRTLPLMVVPGLAAALFANFTSIGIACASGLAIGILQSLMYYVSTMHWFPTDQGVPLPGVQPLLVFVLVVVALFLRGTSLPSRGELVERPLPPVPMPRNMARWTVIGTTGSAVALIVLPYDFRQAVMTSMIAAVLILSIVVITGFVGQVSLVQLALSGVSGFVVARMVNEWDIGFPIGPLIGIAVATVFGVVIGVSALRVRGVQLAVVTLAAAVAIERFFFANNTFGAGGAGQLVPPPEFLGIDLGSQASFRGIDGKLPSPILGFLILAVTVLMCLFVSNLRRSELGQKMVAVRSNERAAASVGVNVRNIKIIGFAISSFIAGVAGVLYAYTFGSMSANRFSALAALGLIAFAYIGGITMVSGAIMAGAISTEAFFPHLWEKWFGLSGTWSLLIGGAFLVFNLIFYPDGAAGAMHRKRLAREAEAAARAGPGITTVAATTPGARW